jgi:hypothetical protein
MTLDKTERQQHPREKVITILKNKCGVEYRGGVYKSVSEVKALFGPGIFVVVSEPKFIPIPTGEW